MRRITVWTVLLACLAILPLRGAEWVTHSGDNQRTGWQKNETAISKDSVKNLKLLWKITLDTKQRSVYSLYGPLIVERAITDRGFKELAIVAGADNDLFAVDADLGKLFWKKHFDWHADVPETTQASFLCPGGLTAWPVLQPLPQRGRGAPAPPAAPARAAPPTAPAAPPPAPRAAPPLGAPTMRPAAPPAAPAPAAPPPRAAPPAPAAPAAPPPASGQRASPLRPVNPFMVQDPKQKARRLARALVSDLVVYHPEKRQQGLRDGTLPQLFKDEIEKSLQEYVEQVGAELAKSTPFWAEALNEILAGGNKVF